MDKNLKIKPLSKAQIIISIDRLTRFKPTEEKYLRVFKELVTSNLIHPKYKKNELNMMDYEKLTNLTEKIFNFSLNALKYPSNTDFSINKKLFEYEKSIFKFDKNVEKLLENKIDYSSIIKLLDGGIAIPPYGGDRDLPLNLKWLKSLAEDDNQIQNRTNFGLKFPIKKLVIAEGITEEILLPKFAAMSEINFDKEGIHLISAGGKNQSVKLFYKFAEILNLPIFVLLDNDAKENYEEIKPKLRKNDKVYIIKSGEFEDLLPLGLIKRTLNRKFKNFYSVALEDLRKPIAMTKNLEYLFKECGLEFKKAEFASLVSQNIESTNDLSPEIKDIISDIIK